MGGWHRHGVAGGMAMVIVATRPAGGMSTGCHAPRDSVTLTREAWHPVYNSARQPWRGHPPWHRHVGKNG